MSAVEWLRDRADRIEYHAPQPPELAVELEFIAEAVPETGAIDASLGYVNAASSLREIASTLPD